jgi:hypothetical protein
MFSLFNPQENKEKDLIAENARLDRAIDEFFSEHKIDVEKISRFVSNPSYFSEKDWLRLQEEREKLAERLEKNLAAVKDPLALKKKYQERHSAQNWLFVR